MNKKRWTKFFTVMTMLVMLSVGAVPTQAMSNADPALGQVALFAGKAPTGWVECNGQSLKVPQNQALYALIKNSFGGNTSNFNVPNLSGKSPVTGAKYYIASTGYFGLNTAGVVIGEVCLLPDALVNNPSSSAGNWKLCNGSSLSSAVYPELAQRIGTYYGGTPQQFNVPDLRKKTPISNMHYYIAVAQSPDAASDGTDNYMGSMNLYAFSIVPDQEILCNGQALPISQNTALYQVIGGTYGGNAVNFNVPNATTPMTSPLTKYCMTIMGIFPN